MNEIKFDEKTHKYFLDGKEIPSVSELCQPISKMIYGDIDEATLQRAAERGTAVHKATEELDRMWKTEVDEDYSGYIEAYKKFYSENEVEWEMIEEIVYTQDYAGRIDRFGTINGIKCIVDIKTSSQIAAKTRKLYRAALVLYNKALLYCKGESAFLLYILHLKKDGNYKLIEIKRNKRDEHKIINALITLNKLMKEK